MSRFEHDYTNSSNEYATKPSLWRPLADAVGGFDVDPASGAESEHIADTVYTKADDGLAHAWHGTVWLNPPFSEKTDWFRKAVGQVNEGNADTVVALAPVDTSTQWFQNWYSKGELICWLEGRDWYVAEGSPSFNTSVAVFGDVPGELVTVLDSKGTVTRPVQVHEQQTL